MNRSRHYLVLALILLLGVGLRFWNLDTKPVWLDEVLTAIFSLGHNFNQIPLDRIVPLTALEQIFSFNSNTTCAQIAATVTTQSVHPPLFFCWLHQWMMWLSGVPQSWIWKLRSLPAIAGVLGIVAVYQLNRLAFSARAGLMAAAVMAVSPFAVYLSQEARHYTIPMLLVILALMGLYQMHLDLYHRRFRPLIWLGWVVVNSLGFYVHYFFLLAFFAQVITLVVNAFSLKFLPVFAASLSPGLDLRRCLGEIAVASAAVCLAYLPWLPTLTSHINRPEVDWLDQGQVWTRAIAPLYQMPIGWILMVIALPVEEQPTWVVVISVVVMVGFIGWLFGQVKGRLGQLWSNPATHLPTRMLVVFLLIVVGEFLAIAYILGKDITQVPRYNFLYFPVVCALVGASLATPLADDMADRQRQFWGRKLSGRGVLAVVMLAGMISSGFTVTDQVFLKPYNLVQAAQNMELEPTKPLIMSLAYLDYQDVAMGLSFALALQAESVKPAQDSFAFVRRSQGYEVFWPEIVNTTRPVPSPFNLWIIGPGLRRINYPAQLPPIGQPSVCIIDPLHYHRLGVPYQLYRCNR